MTQDHKQDRSVYNCKHLMYEEDCYEDDEIRIYRCKHPSMMTKGDMSDVRCVYDSGWDDNTVDDCEFFEDKVD